MAFIAWDEAEQVAVATEELVQPSMAHVACVAPKPCATFFQMRFSPSSLGSAPGSDDTSFGDFIAEHADASGAPTRAKPAVPNPRRALRGGDFSGAEVKDLIAWAAADPAQELARAKGLIVAGGLISSLSGDGDLEEALARMIRSVTLCKRDDFPDWIDRIDHMCIRLVDLKRSLVAAGAPVSTAAALLLTVLGEDDIDTDRLEVITAAAKLDRLPFSTAARERHWQTLLEMAAALEGGRVLGSAALEAFKTSR